MSPHNMSIFLVTLFMVVVPAAAAAAAADGQDDCKETWCDNYHGPSIRFPFRLKDKQPDHCGYPGFELSCGGLDNMTTVLEFQHLVNTSRPGQQLSFSVKASVKLIDYEFQFILLSVMDVHPILQLTNRSSSTTSPFKAETSVPMNIFHNMYGRYPINPRNYYLPTLGEFTLFNCSGTTKRDMTMLDKTLNVHGFRVYSIYSSSPTTEVPITSCTKMYDVSSVPLEYVPGESFNLRGILFSWSTPNCKNCESNGGNCKFKNNSSTNMKHEIVCIPYPEAPATNSYPPDIASHASLNKSVVAGIICGLVFMLLVFVALFYYIKTYKQKKEDQLKIEMFLNDYKALKPTRYSYVDIKKITNQFKEKLGQGGYGSVYKGQLSNDVLVAVKVLKNIDSNGNGDDFINEVSTIGLIHHVNVVRLVGYCADGSTRALVYEFLPNNSLEKFVCSGKNHKNKFLGWEKMQQIALGTAKGIEYLHQGCAQRILHFDIKPHNILLDKNFNPKISDFGLAKLCSKGQSVVSMTMARGTIGYIAPEVFSRNFGKVSPKSDVYSFGMLLLEMVGAKDDTRVGIENTSETYFPEWIFHHLEQGGEVRIQIEKEVDTKIARKLTIVGLWCIGWHPVDRPSMKHVIQMLEGENCPAIPPNPFSSTTSRNATATTRARPFSNDLEIISESETENKLI